MIVACGVNLPALNLLGAGFGAPISTVPDLDALLALLAAAPAPLLVVLGPELTVEQTLDTAQRLHQAGRGALVVVLRTTMNRWARRQAMEAGVSAILTDDSMLDAGRRCREFLTAATSTPIGRLVTVLAGKPGSGTTTVAVNLALALARGTQQRIALVDLDLRSGDVAQMLGLTPTRTLMPGPADRAALDAMVTPYVPGLDCFLAPVRPGAAERLEAEGVAVLLGALLTRYDVVVVDTPASFTPPVVTALDGSEHHVLITTPERPAMNRLRATLDAMDLLGHRRDSRSVLVNRLHPGAGMTPKDLDDALRAPIAGVIPWSPDVAGSINQRSPLVASLPDHPVSAAIRGFAETRLVRPAGLPSRALGGAVT